MGAYSIEWGDKLPQQEKCQDTYGFHQSLFRKGKGTFFMD